MRQKPIPEPWPQQEQAADSQAPTGQAPIRAALMTPTDWRRAAILGAARLPLAFPSVGHLTAEVERVLERMARVEGLQDGTIRWVRGAFVGICTYMRAARSERSFLGGDARLQTRVLEGWIGWMRQRGLSRTTINNSWRALRLAFSRLETLQGRVNPLSLVDAPRVGRVLPRCLTRPAAERLIVAVRNFDWGSRLERAAMVASVGLMLLAGLRRGEVLRLENSDIDVEAGTIRVRGGKGRHGGKDRVAYAPPQLQEILAAYQTERRASGCILPVLLTTTGTKSLGLGTLRRLFRVASRMLGERVTPHMLRHTYATLLRQAGVPDRVAMDLLGHASLEILQRYSHVFDGEHRREAARLSLDLGGGKR